MVNFFLLSEEKVCPRSYMSTLAQRHLACFPVNRFSFGSRRQENERDGKEPEGAQNTITIQYKTR